MAFHPSGDQFTIVADDQHATIVEVGGGVREYAVGARPVLEPYAVDAICDGGHGAPLIPWPNRLADGRYRFDDADYQLPLTEPAKRNAIHGLLRWRPWVCIEQEPSRVVMGARLLPLSGYPFGLSLRIAYALGAGGLEVSTTATNIGDRACPFGSGQHPYLSPGSGLIDDCLFELAAATRITVDPQRSLPDGTEPAAGTAFDFATARPIAKAHIDHPFTDLGRDADGLAVARLRGADGAWVELWADEHYTVLEVFTGDTLSPARRRRALAVEPMTCPPNAFQSGDGLIRLEPGESLTTRWGARLCR